MSHDLIGLLFSEQWAGAAAPLALLALAGIPHASNYVLTAGVNARGRPDVAVRYSLAIMAMRLAGSLGAAPHGVLAVAAANLVVTVGSTFVVLALTRRHLPGAAGLVARSLWAPALATAAMAGAVTATGLLLRRRAARGPAAGEGRRRRRCATAPRSYPLVRRAVRGAWRRALLEGGQAARPRRRGAVPEHQPLHRPRLLPQASDRIRAGRAAHRAGGRPSATSAPTASSRPRGRRASARSSGPGRGTSGRRRGGTACSAPWALAPAVGGLRGAVLPQRGLPPVLEQDGARVAPFVLAVEEQGVRDARPRGRAAPSPPGARGRTRCSCRAARADQRRRGGTGRRNPRTGAARG